MKSPKRTVFSASQKQKVKAITHRLKRAKDKVIDELTFELSKLSAPISATPKSPQNDSSLLVVSHSLWKVLSPGIKKIQIQIAMCRNTNRS